jgi:hypothetical protein
MEELASSPAAMIVAKIYQERACRKRLKLMHSYAFVQLAGKAKLAQLTRMNVRAAHVVRVCAWNLRQLVAQALWINPTVLLLVCKIVGVAAVSHLVVSASVWTPSLVLAFVDIRGSTVT